MFFFVNNLAVQEETFFAAVKRHVVHADPCAEYVGYVPPEGATVGSSWVTTAKTGTVTAGECWDALVELHGQTWKPIPEERQP